MSERKLPDIHVTSANTHARYLRFSQAEDGTVIARQCHAFNSASSEGEEILLTRSKVERLILWLTYAKEKMSFVDDGPEIV